MSVVILNLTIIPCAHHWRISIWRLMLRLEVAGSTEDIVVVDNLHIVVCKELPISSHRLILL